MSTPDMRATTRPRIGVIAVGNVSSSSGQKSRLLGSCQRYCRLPRASVLTETFSIRKSTSPMERLKMENLFQLNERESPGDESTIRSQQLSQLSPSKRTINFQSIELSKEELLPDLPIFPFCQLPSVHDSLSAAIWLASDKTASD